MNNLKSKLGARIQEIRKSKNITQEKLAEMINLDTPNLSNIERGKKFMTAETLEKIINALDIKPYELFYFEHKSSRQELEAYVNNASCSLSDSELEFLCKVIDNLFQLRN